ncbi:MAG: hypothetical protein AAF683_03740 [Pseudomonadota bacterium]
MAMHEMNPAVQGSGSTSDPLPASPHIRLFGPVDKALYRRFWDAIERAPDGVQS